MALLKSNRNNSLNIKQLPAQELQGFQVKETRWPALCSIFLPFLKKYDEKEKKIHEDIHPFLRNLKEIQSIFCSFSLYVARDRQQ
jgi:hypothetical protein